MEDDLVMSSSPPPNPINASFDHHKRKLEDLEPPTESEPNSDPHSVKNASEVEDNGGAGESDPKRPCLEKNGNNINEADDIVSLNGHQEKKANEPQEGDAEQPESADEGQSLEGLEPAKALETTTEEPVSNENEKPETESAEELGPNIAKVEEPSEEILNDGNVSTAELQPVSETQVVSRKMEVPNDKVGVLIGKAGDTIRSLQDNSGAKIQIVKDADADPEAATRPLELVGTLENINKAEKLIKDVIAEADAGGSPSLVARGFSTVQAAGGGEQLEILVAIEKVGLIIGKGGETIRNLQTRSGARIQLIQQNLSDGVQSRKRTVRVTGNKKQIETAREMIKDVMNQTIKSSPLSGGYSKQSYRPHGPVASQLGPRGPHHGQYSGYDYPQRGPYNSQGSRYPPPTYGNYPPQQTLRSNFGSSWERRPPASVHGPSPQGNYNYGQQQGPNYGQAPPYFQTPAQPYVHGYNEVKYDHHASSQHFGHMGSQPTPFAQGGGTHSGSGYGPQDQYGKPPMYGYGPQDQYGKPPIYGMQPQVHHAQPYGQPRPNQPGEASYQGPISSTQLYGQNVPPQSSYTYASSGSMQQSYPPYGSVSTTDGYGHLPIITATASGYPSQGGQPITGYGQPGAQQPPAYLQAGPAGGYGSYPTAQPSYAEQPAANNATYGYQGPADPASGGAQDPAAATLGYAQPSQTQPSTYGNVATPAGYVKSVSPQSAYAQYDSSQMYGANR